MNLERKEKSFEICERNNLQKKQNDVHDFKKKKEKEFKNFKNTLTALFFFLLRKFIE